jgi:hypothetical protein
MAVNARRDITVKRIKEEEEEEEKWRVRLRERSVFLDSNYISYIIYYTPSLIQHRSYKLFSRYH